MLASEYTDKTITDPDFHIIIVNLEATVSHYKHVHH